jgi:nucleotide-binding universal stress UspA family protein
MYKCILIPTDGTEFCERAIRHGIDLAKQQQAKIVGLTVTQPLHTGTPRSMIPANIAGMIHAETVKMAAEKLAFIEKTAKAAGVPFETVTESDDHPWHAIVHTAKSKGCDLIVMASHGRRGVTGMILGSEDAEGADALDRSRPGRALSPAAWHSHRWVLAHDATKRTSMTEGDQIPSIIFQFT